MRKIFTFILLMTAAATGELRGAECKVGAARFEAYIHLLQGKRVGITANHTSQINGRHLVDILLEKNINITRIYAPEHGFRGTADAGEQVMPDKDKSTGIDIISLYGKSRKPSAQQLQGIDCMLFDMQDVGLRYFTYLSTMHYVMEACAEQDIPVIILDRPNPNGFYVDGPVLEPQHRSFVGLHPIPVVHGMSLGELAQMINGEKWLSHGVQCRLTVVPCTGYTHNTLYRLPVKPSPNLPNMQSVYLYAALCPFEGTVISLGRGTAFPFQVFGHPAFKGLYPFLFTPEAMPGTGKPPLKGQRCYGIDLREYPENTILAEKRIPLKWLLEAYRNFPEKDQFFTHYFTTLWGTTRVQTLMKQGATEQQIRHSWKAEVEQFLLLRKKYLLYE